MKKTLFAIGTLGLLALGVQSADAQQYYSGYGRGNYRYENRTTSSGSFGNQSYRRQYPFGGRGDGGYRYSGGERLPFNHGGDSRSYSGDYRRPYYGDGYFPRHTERPYAPYTNSGRPTGGQNDAPITAGTANSGGNAPNQVRPVASAPAPTTTVVTQQAPQVKQPSFGKQVLGDVEKGAGTAITSGVSGLVSDLFGLF